MSPRAHSSDSMYAVHWRHYTKSSRTMVGFKDGQVKAPKTQKEIDVEILKIRQELDKLND